MEKDEEKRKLGNNEAESSSSFWKKKPNKHSSGEDTDSDLEDCEPLCNEILQKEFKLKLPNLRKKYDNTSYPRDYITIALPCVSKGGNR